MPLSLQQAGPSVPSVLVASVIPHPGPVYSLHSTALLTVNLADRTLKYKDLNIEFFLCGRVS